MARLWPGNTITDYLTIPASAVWNFNTNVCLMAILRVTTLRATGNTAHIAVIAPVPTSLGYGLGMMDTTGVLDALRMGINNEMGTSTTALSASQWYAIYTRGSSGGNVDYKRYTYSTETLATEVKVTTDGMTAPTTNAGTIGNNPSPTANFSWCGDIDRVLIGQGSASDAEFIAWARAGTLPPSVTVKGYWILSPSGTATSPEVDASGNGLNLTSITGTTASPAFVLPDSIALQTARPNADTFVSGWEEQDGTTDALYARLNEDPADNSNYIRTALSPSSAIYVTKLTSLPEPPDDANHTLRLRLGKDPVGGQPINFTVQLRTGYVNEGSPGTLVTEEVYSGVAGGFTEVSMPLLTTEADDLDTAEYLGSLYVRVVATAP